VRTSFNLFLSIHVGFSIKPKLAGLVFRLHSFIPFMCEPTYLHRISAPLTHSIDGYLSYYHTTSHHPVLLMYSFTTLSYLCAHIIIITVYDDAYEVGCVCTVIKSVSVGKSRIFLHYLRYIRSNLSVQKFTLYRIACMISSCFSSFNAALLMMVIMTTWWQLGRCCCWWWWWYDRGMLMYMYYMFRYCKIHV